MVNWIYYAARFRSVLFGFARFRSVSVGFVEKGYPQVVPIVSLDGRQNQLLMVQLASL